MYGNCAAKISKDKNPMAFAESEKAAVNTELRLMKLKSKLK